MGETTYIFQHLGDVGGSVAAVGLLVEVVRGFLFEVAVDLEVGEERGLGIFDLQSLVWGGSMGPRDQ